MNKKPPRPPVKYNPEHIKVAMDQKYIREKTLENMVRNLSVQLMDANQQLELIKQKLLSSPQYVKGKTRTFEVSQPEKTIHYVKGNTRTFEVTDYNFKSKNKKSVKRNIKKSLKRKVRK